MNSKNLFQILRRILLPPTAGLIAVIVFGCSSSKKDASSIIVLCQSTNLLVNGQPISNRCTRVELTRILGTSCRTVDYDATMCSLTRTSLFLDIWDDVGVECWYQSPQPFYREIVLKFKCREKTFGNQFAMDLESKKPFQGKFVVDGETIGRRVSDRQFRRAGCSEDFFVGPEVWRKDIAPYKRLSLFTDSQKLVWILPPINSFTIDRVTIEFTSNPPSVEETGPQVQVFTNDKRDLEQETPATRKISIPPLDTRAE